VFATMSIQEIRYFHVEIPYPERVWELFDDDREFNYDFMAAVENATNSGTDAYCGILWADCTTRHEAMSVQTLLFQFIARYIAKAERYDRDAETESLRDA
jgi:hypothetical protein